MTRVYIAGPMTGIPEFNYPAFHEAEAALKDEEKGYLPINPARNYGGSTDLPRERYLKTAIHQVAEADAVMVLEGWEDSPGARLEVHIAEELGIGVWASGCFLDFGPVPACQIYLAEDGSVKWPSCNYGARKRRSLKNATMTIIPPEGTATPNDCNGDGDCSWCREDESASIEDWKCGDCGAVVPGGVDWCTYCAADAKPATARENIKEAIDYVSAQFKGEHGPESVEFSGNSVEFDGKCPCTLCKEYNAEPVVDEAAPLVSVRAATLDEAKRLVTGDRNAQYGPPTQDFSRTADMLTAIGFRLWDQRPVQGSMHAIKPSDIAIIMAQLKISRLMHSRDKMDSWVDLAGYAACGAECARDADE